MSELRQSDLHLDPDSFSAFVEGVLPEHDRQRCLAHLAECSRCREVLYLAQEPAPAPAAAEPLPAWRRWFALPVPVVGLAAVAGVLVLAVSAYLLYTRTVPTRDLSARSQPTLPKADSPSPEIRPEPPVPAAVAPKAPRDAQTRAKRRVRFRAEGTTPDPARATPENLQPPIASPAQPSPVPPPAPAPPPASQVAEAPGVNIRDDQKPADTLSGIAGRVSDPTQAALPGASITVRQVDGTLTIVARTDVTGHFSLRGLPAGRYDVQITAPGFRQTSSQVDVGPRDVTTVNSELAIGSVSESVEVTAAAPSIQTESSMSVGKRRRESKSPAEPRPLPSKLPATITAASGKIVLAVDSAGTLFVSRNQGKRWKPVRPLWSGKVLGLVALSPPQPSSAAFRLSTSSNADWLSRDGIKWYPAPEQP